GVPISGYYAVYMDAVPAIVDAVGGVKVTIDEDMTRANRTFKRGKEVVLTGKTALDYLQFRNESNQPRLERQKTFLKSFVSQAKSAVLKNLSLPVTLYKEVASKTVTNVSVTSVAYFASEAKDTDVQFRSIQGTSGFDGFYETFEADENQLYLLLLDVFYKKQ
ncbi:MAG: LCP family protein, partial [Clostridia bacterium]|nr:LCP family protein [Clostridia bacterium]